MAIHITNNQGIFKIKGNIIAENATSLQKHFETLLTKTDEVIICMDNVKKIDPSGVMILTKLFKNAMKNNKIFYVIGKENKIINTAFGNVSYILKNDFI